LRIAAYTKTFRFLSVQLRVWDKPEAYLAQALDDERLEDVQQQQPVGDAA